MIELVHGNIFDGNEDVICHQVNLQKVMGAGIALQIKQRFPDVYKKYIESDSKLGDIDVILATIYNGNQKRLYIANLYSQNNYGYFGTHTNYEAMNKCFKKLHDFIKIDNLSLAIPYGIGCGLGGGDWDLVSRIIERNFNDINCKVYKLED